VRFVSDWSLGFGRIHLMRISASQRLIACILAVSLFLSSCSTSGPSNLYPTYDPFAPVNGASSQVAPVEVGEFMRATQMAGATPTRAPISVNIPAHNPGSAQTTPTPDAPHALPAQRDFLDQYTVEPGDTLGNIAQKYGITLEALMQANGLNESSLLTVGMVLKIPPIEADPNRGSVQPPRRGSGSCAQTSCWARAHRALPLSGEQPQFGPEVLSPCHTD